MKSALVLFFLLISVIYADHLKCLPGVVDFYSYKTQIDRDGEPDMKIEGLIGLTCTGITSLPKVQGDLLVMVVETTNIKVTQLVKDASSTGSSGQFKDNVEYNKRFQKPLTFLQKRNGEIITLLHQKDELPSILSLKKSMISHFQIKMEGQTKIEVTQAGEIQFMYEKAASVDGKLVIRKSSTEVLKQADPSMKRKDNKYTLVSLIQINPEDKKAHRIYTEEGSSIGKPSKRRHDAYQKEKTKTENDQHPDGFNKSGASQAFEFGSVTTIQLIQTGELGTQDGKAKVVLKKSEGKNTLDFNEIIGTDEFTTSTLELDERVIQEHKQLAKEKFIADTDFPQLLKNIRQDTKDQNLLASAHMYVNHYGPDIIPHIVQEYKGLDLSQKEHLDYGISLLSMFTASQTEHGQRELVKTMDHHATVQQAVINTMALENPSDEIVEKLRTLSENETFKGLDENESSDIKTNAYLAYAHSASKLPTEKSTKILNEISDNILKANTVNEFEKQIHALGNTGEVAPIHSLAVIATNEYLPINLRLAAINGLSNRVSDQSHKEVTNLLHHLMGEQYTEAVRVSSVQAQTKRESEIQDGVSVLHLKQYLEDVRTPSTLVQAIKEYYLEEGSENSHKILDATKLGLTGHIGERKEAVKVMAVEGYFENSENTLDEETEVFEAKPLFFKRIKGAFRKVGRAFRKVGGAFRKAGRWIGNAARRVGTAIVKAAKDVYKKTIGAVVEKVKSFVRKLKEQFSKARFKGEKVCIQVNAAGSNICIYDPDMVGFVRKQGDLSAMKWTRQFSFETLIGVEILHVYIGTLGYAGTRIDCATNSFDIVIFGRGEAKARLFGRRVPILKAEVELQKRSEEQLLDRAYLSVFSGVIFNGGFVPEKIRKAINICERVSRQLIKPIRKTLVNFSFSIVVVVVPLTFNIQITAEMGVDLVNIICPGRLTLTISLEPYVGVGVSAYAGIGFALISGGVKVDFDSNYRLKPGFGTSNCNLCAVLDHEIRPIKIVISLAAKAFTYKIEKKLYTYEGPVIRQRLFELCLFKDKPYNPESVLSL